MKQMEAVTEILTDDQRRQNKVALAERLLARKQETTREMRQIYKTDSYIQQIVSDLKAKNAASHHATNRL